MSILRFEIRYPNGHREAAVVEGERALIGSASYSDVRLPVDQAAYEHVVIEAIGQTLRAQAKAQHPPATVNGMPLTSSPILPDTVLGVGSVQIFVSLGSGDVERPRAGSQKEKKKRGSPIIRILGLIALPALGYMVIADDEPPLPAPLRQRAGAVRLGRRRLPRAISASSSWRWRARRGIWPRASGNGTPSRLPRVSLRWTSTAFGRLLSHGQGGRPGERRRADGASTHRHHYRGLSARAACDSST